MDPLLACMTVGVSALVGVAQLRAFRRTGRLWRLVFGILALGNGVAGFVLLVLILSHTPA